MSLYHKFYRTVLGQLEEVFTSQHRSIETAARWLADALAADHWLYAFGTGHSHLLAEEIFYRAGGLAHAAPILDENLMLHYKAIEATHVERREGYARKIIRRYPVEPGDVLLVFSNSGRNAVPVEMALAGRERGLKVVAVTNVRHARAWPSRHSSGKKLMDVADLTIDNCGVEGDAALKVPGMATAIGPTSTITGGFIVNALVVRALELSFQARRAPEIFISSNTMGDTHNDRLLNKYRKRIRHL